jgi:Tol biopolymer transport system component
MHRSLRALLAGALLFAAAIPCAAQGRVAFVRWTYNPDDTLRSSTLYRVNADGTGFQQLAPATANVYRFDPQWSPSGNTIAYQYQAGPGAMGQIWRMSATGTNRTRISSGTRNHEWPTWRPDGGMLLFVTHLYATGSHCLAIVRPDGTGQRNLFCPPAPTFIDYRPRWSADGSRIFVATNLRGSGLEPPYYSRAYSINASTGVATLLTSQTFEDERRLVINPAGTGGLYVDSSSDDIDAVDFATDAVVPRAQGRNPVWSQGGTRFAYEKTTFTDTAIYTHVWIMSADGSTDTEIPMPAADGVTWSPVEFSRDATRILTDRYNGSTVAMRLFNVGSGTWVTLPNGSANDWYQP